MSRDTNPTKNRGLTWVPLRVSSSFSTRVTRHVTLVTNQMRKGQDYDYHKLNISMVISDTSHDGDEKLYFIYYFFHLNIFMFFFLPSTICCCVLNYIATFLLLSRSRDRMVNGFTTIYAISAYYH